MMQTTRVGASPLGISFLIALRDCLPLTQACLSSLWETVPQGDYEVVLVDDASTDGTRAFLRALGEPYRVLFNDRNAGFAASMNRAAHSARGRVICFLNNDTVLLPHWLEPMLALLRGSADAGVVGNIQVRPGTDTIDHAGVFFDLRGHPEHVLRGSRRMPAGAWSEHNAVSASCCIMRRATFVASGGFDEAFRNGYEDVDLCVRLRCAGYRCLVAHASVIEHHGASAPGRADHDDANRERFLNRWAHLTAQWGQHEWPARYLQRCAHCWWRSDMRQVARALWMIARCPRHAPASRAE